MYGIFTHFYDKFKPNVGKYSIHGELELGGGNSNIFGIFTPYPWGNDPIGRSHIFQMGWFNHQLEELLCFFQVSTFRDFPRLHV